MSSSSLAAPSSDADSVSVPLSFDSSVSPPASPKSRGRSFLSPSPMRAPRQSFHSFKAANEAKKRRNSFGLPAPSDGEIAAMRASADRESASNSISDTPDMTPGAGAVEALSLPPPLAMSPVVSPSSSSSSHHHSASEPPANLNKETFARHRLFLTFKDPAMEQNYRSLQLKKGKPKPLPVLFALSVLFLAEFYRQADNYNANSDDAKSRIILLAISAVLLISRTLIMMFGVGFTNPHFQPLFFFLTAATGVLWSVGGALELSGASASHAICISVVLHHLGAVQMFPFCMLSTIAIFVSYLVTSAAAREQTNPVANLVGEILYLMLFSLLSCLVTQASESLKRTSFVNSELHRLNLRKLETDQNELRNEVFHLVLEKFDVADVSNFADSELLTHLQSPLEKCMIILQNLQRDKHLSREHFNRVTEVIQLLASSEGDFFRPKIDNLILQSEKITGIDEETLMYFVELVDQDAPARRTSSVDWRHLEAANKAKLEEQAAKPLQLIIESENDVVTKEINVDQTAAHAIEEAKQRDRLADPAAGEPHRPSLSATSASRASDGLAIFHLNSHEERSIAHLQTQLEDWNFDVFEVSVLTKGHPLLFLGIVLFKKFNFLQLFNIELQTLTNFFNAIERGYQPDIPYHNATHGCDVMRSMYFFIMKGGLNSYLTPLEVMAALIGGSAHDLGHGGVNNNYLIRTKDPLAIHYNDRSVLESMHAASTFKILLQPENNIFAKLSPKQFEDARKVIIETILATDLAQHHNTIGQFKQTITAAVATNAGSNAPSPAAAVSPKPGPGAGDSSPKFSIDPSNESHRLQVLKMAMKSADVGHAAKNEALHIKWSSRIIEEFYRQGDREKELGLPISPFMDRTRSNVSKSQIGFIEFIAAPLYETWCSFLNKPDHQVPCLRQLVANKEYWKRYGEMPENQEKPDKP